MATSEPNRVSSAQFKHSDTCGLFDPHHTIPVDIADVVEELDGYDGFEAVAGGCMTCTAHLLDEGVYYIAQQGEPDTVYFGYTSETAAYTLIDACVEAGVKYDWTGETNKKVAVGTADAYDGHDDD